MCYRGNWDTTSGGLRLTMVKSKVRGLVLGKLESSEGIDTTQLNIYSGLQIESNQALFGFSSWIFPSFSKSIEESKANLHFTCGPGEAALLSRLFAFALVCLTRRMRIVFRCEGLFSFEGGLTPINLSLELISFMQYSVSQFPGVPLYPPHDPQPCSRPRPRFPQFPQFPVTSLDPQLISTGSQRSAQQTFRR
jgi:hypothetical protein